MWVKILLIDDHSLFAEGLRILLKDFDQQVQLVCCNSCEAALEQPEPETVELILLDYYLPGISGVEALSALRDYCPNSRITVVSALDDPKHIRRIIDAGAAGFIPKTSTFAVMSAALHLVLAGGTYLPPQAIEEKPRNQVENHHLDLHHVDAHHADVHDGAGRTGLDCLSVRQREVIMQVVQGKPNKVIARTLDISEHTVKAHISASFKLLGVSNRTEAVYAAAKLYRDEQTIPLS